MWVVDLVAVQTGGLSLPVTYFHISWEVIESMCLLCGFYFLMLAVTVSIFIFSLQNTAVADAVQAHPLQCSLEGFCAEWAVVRRIILMFMKKIWPLRSSHFIRFLVFLLLSSVQFSSVTQSRPTLCDPMNYTAHQASLSITNSQNLPKSMSTESMMPSNHLILCRPLLLLPSIFSSISVFSNETLE